MTKNTTFLTVTPAIYQALLDAGLLRRAYDGDTWGVEREDDGMIECWLISGQTLRRTPPSERPVRAAFGKTTR